MTKNLGAADSSRQRYHLVRPLIRQLLRAAESRRADCENNAQERSRVSHESFASSKASMEIAAHWPCQWPESL